MIVQLVEARPGSYADSVTLMQVSARARAVPGVRSALIAMATELNLELLGGLGQQTPPGSGPNDLLIAITADDDAALTAALAAVEAALAERPPEASGGGAALPPRTTGSAARRLGGTGTAAASGGPAADGGGLALISVPGQHAFTEAMDAIEAGCDVMIFSDNVPVEQEIALKDAAADRGLLVMGPDCGTAIVGGVGLGFSHSVPPGPVGLVAASGTGLQQVICLLDVAAVGVSAALGLGGRDLSAAVGGRSARAALAALDADPATELIVLLSKPPAAEVAASLTEFAAGLSTPVQFALLGAGQADLTQVTEAALAALGRAVPQWPTWGAAALDRENSVIWESSQSVRLRGLPDHGKVEAAGAIRGLFSGGTLCDEAMIIASGRLGRVWSNIPLQPHWLTDPRSPAPGHAMIDFGDDQLTTGRPHPMIDQGLRLERLAAEAADLRTGVLLLDVVLGHGAHPDPASELAPAIAAARAARAASTAGDLPVVISLVGAGSDPQGRDRQATALAGAGAAVFLSNAQAARFACDLIGVAN